ncbi:MAG: permease-like cell division protein FtsX [Prevotellaceae bacterium]|jgi:cell division transport system permease protein|nr:permease-like cell division protein FtsX [Prevotellaceae bacterium]
MAVKENRITSVRLRTSYLSSVISTALVLFLLGVAGLLVYNTGRLSNVLHDNIAVSVIMRDTVSDKDAVKTLAMVERQNYVRTVKYVSKEEVAKEMQNDLGSDFINLLGENPLPIELQIKLKKEYFSSDSVASIQKRLEKFPGVGKVVYQKSLLEAVSRNTDKISAIILIFVLLLLFVSIFLINNTIRLSIYSKRFTINTMKLVGANTSFIRTPFLASSVWQGLLSGFIAILLLLGLIALLRNDFSELLELTDAQMFAVLFSCMLIMGSLISFISTYIIVTKYTKVSTDDLWEG